MKALVTVTESATVADDFVVGDDGIDEAYVEYDLNEWDDYAVEAGVQLAEAGVVDDVVAVTIAPERAEETVRKALAKGVDRAVRVWDDALADQDLVDVSTKARLLAAVAEDEGADVVLSGVQASDDGFGATGVALAEHLGYEWAAVVSELDVDADAGEAAVHRELEGGLQERLRVDLPAVFTIQSGINEPRYASLRGIRQAQSKEIATTTPADLGVADVTSRLELAATFVPESENETVYFEGDTDEQAAQLADALRDAGVVSE